MHQRPRLKDGMVYFSGLRPAKLPNVASMTDAPLDRVVEMTDIRRLVLQQAI